jgi:hypothetical protein
MNNANEEQQAGKVVSVHLLKARGEMEVELRTHTLKLVTGWRRAGSFTPRLLCPQGAGD